VTPEGVMLGGPLSLLPPALLFSLSLLPPALLF